jgi:hypothetical protein
MEPVATDGGAIGLGGACVLHGGTRGRRLVVLGGPLADQHRVVLAYEAETEDAVRATLARDPWHQTHLVVDTIDPWRIRLDGRRA